MSTLLVAVLSFVGFIVAYNTYGRWLARRIFRLRPDAVVPSQALRDDVDFVPTRWPVVFGHHFTSIAGTGPIVGPAIAVFWGWLPALIWVVVGSIFVGAVHDFGAVVLSLRHEGQTIGQVAGKLISPRARLLFLLVLVLELTIVLAVFGLVIAVIFATYPEAVMSAAVQMPLAVMIGFWVYRRGGGLLWSSLAALVVMYGAIYLGTIVPVNLGGFLSRLVGHEVPLVGQGVFLSVVVVWTLILFAYCFLASVLPVWILLQPRDYINAIQLFVAMAMLLVGLAVAGGSGKADLFASAPAVAPAAEIPADAPPLWPFLFITIACGAVSGFHSLVGSGTSSKQIAREPDAQMIGYGSMLLEGALAVLVIMACCAGVGMGGIHRNVDGKSYQYVQASSADGTLVVGRQAWRAKYDFDTGSQGGKGGWAAQGITETVGAFIEGGANFLTAIGVPLKLAVGILAVLVASFAATTMDTATRLQRYVIEELGSTMRIKPLTNKYVATTVALVSAGALAIFTGEKPGAGGMTLWPMFGALNQLLAGLAFVVVAFYLLRRKLPTWFIIVPAAAMLVLPAWAMHWLMFNDQTGWYRQQNYMLLGFGLAVELLSLWLMVEAAMVYSRLRRRAVVVESTVAEQA